METVIPELWSSETGGETVDTSENSDEDDKSLIDVASEDGDLPAVVEPKKVAKLTGKNFEIDPDCVSASV